MDRTVETDIHYYELGSQQDSMQWDKEASHPQRSSSSLSSQLDELGRKKVFPSKEYYAGLLKTRKVAAKEEKAARGGQNCAAFV